MYSFAVKFFLGGPRFPPKNKASAANVEPQHTVTMSRFDILRFTFSLTSRCLGLSICRYLFGPPLPVDVVIPVGLRHAAFDVSLSVARVIWGYHPATIVGSLALHRKSPYPPPLGSAPFVGRTYSGQRRHPTWIFVRRIVENLVGGHKFAT